MTSPSEHWLLRLDAAAWLAAAQRELELGEGADGLRRRQVTHARRAGGMALNALLQAEHQRGVPLDLVDTKWGRSYIDHLRAAAVDESCDPALRSSCETLMAVPVVAQAAPTLIRLRQDETPGRQAVAAAQELVQLVSVLLADSASA